MKELKTPLALLTLPSACVHYRLFITQSRNSGQRDITVGDVKGGVRLVMK